MDVSHILDDLNDPQREAVSAPAGSMLATGEQAYRTDQNATMAAGALFKLTLPSIADSRPRMTSGSTDSTSARGCPLGKPAPGLSPGARGTRRRRARWRGVRRTRS